MSYEMGCTWKPYMTQREAHNRLQFTEGLCRFVKFGLLRGATQTRATLESGNGKHKMLFIKSQHLRIVFKCVCFFVFQLHILLFYDQNELK